MKWITHHSVVTDSTSFINIWCDDADDDDDELGYGMTSEAGLDFKSLPPKYKMQFI